MLDTGSHTLSAIDRYTLRLRVADRQAPLLAGGIALLHKVARPRIVLENCCQVIRQRQRQQQVEAAGAAATRS